MHLVAGPKELRLEYSQATPLLLAHWAKDNVLLPMIDVSDPMREQVAEMRLFEVAPHSFNPLEAYTQRSKALHDSFLYVLPACHAV